MRFEAAWQSFLLPEPLQLLLAHMRGASPSLRWRALSGKAWPPPQEAGRAIPTIFNLSVLSLNLT